MAERTRKTGTQDIFGGRLSGWWWFADSAEAPAAAIERPDRVDSTRDGENPFAGDDEEMAALSPRERLERLEAFSAA